jgi:hypothetical protein
MKRVAAVTSVLLAVLMVPAFFVAVRYRGEAERRHEACLKDAIFCMQRVTRAAGEAEEYDDVLKVAETLKAEAVRLRELQAEFQGFPEPSRWERSRMRKHRQLAESAVEAWAEVEKDFRERINEGLPPHVRLQLTEALDDFAAARADAWAVMTPYLD